MSAVPARPKIYHITHLDNLPSIVDCGCIWSDAQRLRQELPNANIGMSGIKQRRLTELEVRCHSGTMVGEYVPFYFCSRSVMLYLLHRGNHPGLSYTGGQRPILHLQADLYAVVQWADTQGCRWAFTTSNAGAYYTDFYNSLTDLNRIDWGAVRATNFQDSGIKERKQAEFLVLDAFPWRLVEEVGVLDAQIETQVVSFLARAAHRPRVAVRRAWYY